MDILNLKLGLLIEYLTDFLRKEVKESDLEVVSLGIGKTILTVSTSVRRGKYPYVFYIPLGQVPTEFQDYLRSKNVEV